MTTATLDVTETTDDHDHDSSANDAYVQRRLGVALHDLGWIEIVGVDWATVYDGTVRFEPLRAHRAEAFLRVLEDAGRNPGRTTPTCDGQLRLW